MKIDVEIPEAFKKKYRTTYFDPRKIELSPPRYVAWVDIMGSSQLMRKSHVQSAIAIGHLSSVVLEAADYLKFSGNIYPLVDGAYVTTTERSDLQALLKYIFKLSAINFLIGNTKQPGDLRIIRGSIAFGQVIEGGDICNSAKILKIYDVRYTNKVLLGAPLALAYAAESLAAPFGVWIDETARQFAPNIPSARTIRWTNWPWWDYITGDSIVDDDCKDIERMLAEKLEKYYSWCDRNYISILYDPIRLKDHRERARQYFESWE